MFSSRFNRVNSLFLVVFLFGMTITSQLVYGQTIDWVTQVGGNGFDRYEALARGPNGNLYAAGLKIDNGDWLTRLTKFDADGNVVWQRNYGFADVQFAHDVFVDSAGFVYVVGSSHASGNSDGFLTKYDQDGNQLWHKLVASDANDQALGVVAVANGKIFVVGETNGSLGAQNLGQSDIFLARFNPDGGLADVHQFGTTNGDHCTDIAMDAAGDLFICGYTAGVLEGPFNGGRDAYIAKFNQNFNQIWIDQFGSSQDDFLRGITLDVSGRPVATGDTEGSLGAANAGESDVIVTKFSSGGSPLWLTQVGGPGADIGNNVSVGLNGRVHVAGGIKVGVDFTEGFLKSFVSNGIPLWSRRINVSDSDVAYGVFATPAGEAPAAFVAGATSGDLGGTNQGLTDAFIAKISYGTIVESFDTDIIRGVVSSGSESNLVDSDNEYWSFNPGLTLNATEPPVWLGQVVYLSFESPSSLTATFESSANTVGLSQQIKVFSLATNQYEVVDTRIVSFNNDAIVTVDLSGSIGDHVQPQSDGSGQFRWQVSCRATGPILVFPWEFSIDRLLCDVQ